MDFEKIKPAVDEIQLSEIRQERIIEACEKHKKKSFNYKLWIPVAVAAMFVVVIFSPGFIFRASKSADNMEAEAPENGKGFGYLADSYAGEVNDEEIYVAVEDCITQVVVSAQSQTNAVEVKSLFNSGVYRKIYSVIPSQFAWLVDFEEYKKWEKSVSVAGGMAMLQFVEHFGITREEFDYANEAYASYINSTSGCSILGKPANKSEEELEIFNAEVIYSFDKDRINEYYLADYN
ncbi:MAG: hypothetical protein IKJ41_11130 [Clostridia bacterium]|nr:hypothetical protein [Clostridia bacterium]